jgi:hypothetical protein
LTKESRPGDIPKVDGALWPDVTPEDFAKMVEKMDVPWHTTLTATKLLTWNTSQGEIMFGMKVPGLKSSDQVPVRTFYVKLTNADKINNPEIAKVCKKDGVSELLVIIQQIQTDYDHDGDGKKDMLTGVALTYWGFAVGDRVENKWDEIVEAGTPGSKAPIILALKLTPNDNSLPISQQHADYLGSTTAEKLLVAESKVVGSPDRGSEMIISANELGDGTSNQLDISTKQGMLDAKMAYLKWYWGAGTAADPTFFK